MLVGGERLVLPEPPVPLGHYVAAVRTGSLLMVSGMLPLEAGRPSVVGRLGDDVSIEAGRAAARLAALNALAVAERALGGLHHVRRVVRAVVSMTTSPEFTAHAASRGRPRLQLLPETLSALSNYPWPGNIRELSNLIERLAILCPERPVGIGDLPARYRPADWTAPSIT